MKKHLIGICVLLLFVVSCSEYKYPNDEKVSSSEGAIVDTLGGHIIKELSYNDTSYTFDWNTTNLRLINDYLLETKEPVLFNYYLDRDILRLIVKEKDEDPLIFSYYKEKNKGWMVSKRINTPIEKDSIQSEDNLVLHVNFDNYSRPLEQQNIQKMDSLISNMNFFELDNSQTGTHYDNFYLVERHQKGKYWYVYRSTEDATFRELASFMRSLSMFKN